MQVGVQDNGFAENIISVLISPVVPYGYSSRGSVLRSVMQAGSLNWRQRWASPLNHYVQDLSIP